MIKRLAFAGIILAATAIIAYLLNSMDQIVHGELYNYGLQFSLNWADPYWTLLRIAQVLLAVIAATTVISTVFSLKEEASSKKPNVKTMSTQRIAPRSPAPYTAYPLERPVERPIERHSGSQAAAPTARPEPMILTVPPTSTTTPQTAPLKTSPPTSTHSPDPEFSDVSELIRCSHCGKAFTQPLRMLDFQGDRPRIVSICPFCNEILRSAPRKEEGEPNRRFQLRKRNNNNHHS